MQIFQTIFSVEKILYFYKYNFSTRLDLEARISGSRRI